MRSVTPSRYGADDWSRTSINRFTKPVPSYSATSAKHECKESNPVRQVWKLTALPGAHSCKDSRPKGREPSHFIYFFSSTFQYASLMNFDQLSIRVPWVA